MNTILSPVLSKICQLKSQGNDVQTPAGLQKVRACLLLTVFDLPAKAMATNMIQYNGCHSCSYCLDEGKHVLRRHLFYPEKEHEPRTAHHVPECAKAAETSGIAV